MTIKLLRQPPPPVPYTRTPRCCADIKIQNESERRWRERRYGGEGGQWQCAHPSVVELDGVALCSRHAGEAVLKMYLEGRLVPKKET